MSRKIPMCWQPPDRFRESLSAESGVLRSLWTLLTLLRSRLVLSAARNWLKTMMQSDPRLCSLPAQQGCKEQLSRQPGHAHCTVAGPAAFSGVDGGLLSGTAAAEERSTGHCCGATFSDAFANPSARKQKTGMSCDIPVLCETSPTLNPRTLPAPVHRCGRRPLPRFRSRCFR